MTYGSVMAIDGSNRCEAVHLLLHLLCSRDRAAISGCLAPLIMIYRFVQQIGDTLNSRFSQELGSETSCTSCVPRRQRTSHSQPYGRHRSEHAGEEHTCRVRFLRG